MFYTDDPIRDAEMHDAAQQRELDTRPVCAECDEPIQSASCYEFNGELICLDCLINYHRRVTEDFCS